MTIQQDLVIFNGRRIPILNLFTFIHLVKKVKHWNLDLFGYGVIGADC